MMAYCRHGYLNVKTATMQVIMQNEMEMQLKTEPYALDIGCITEPRTFKNFRLKYSDPLFDWIWNFFSKNVFGVAESRLEDLAELSVVDVDMRCVATPVRIEDRIRKEFVATFQAQILTKNDFSNFRYAVIL